MFETTEITEVTEKKPCLFYSVTSVISNKRRERVVQIFFENRRVVTNLLLLLLFFYDQLLSHMNQKFVFIHVIEFLKLLHGDAVLL